MRGEVWLYLIGGVLVGSLLLREGQLFVVALILLLVAGVSRVWERYCLVGVGYRRSLGQTRAFFGEEVPLTVEIVNDKPLPLAWLEIEDTVPGGGMTRHARPRRPVAHPRPAPARHAAVGALVRARPPPLPRHAAARAAFTPSARPPCARATSSA